MTRHGDKDKGIERHAGSDSTSVRKKLNRVKLNVPEDYARRKHIVTEWTTANILGATFNVKLGEYYTNDDLTTNKRSLPVSMIYGMNEYSDFLTYVCIGIIDYDVGTNRVLERVGNFNSISFHKEFKPLKYRQVGRIY